MRFLLPLAAAAILLAGCDGGGTGPGTREPEFEYPPETVAREIALGQTIEAERIDSIGDVDLFAFDAPAGGALVALVLQATGSSDGQLISASLYDSAGGVPWGVQHNPRGEFPAARWVTLTPGRWHLRVLGLSRSLGTYRVTVQPVNTAPEQVDSVLIPGTWAHEEIGAHYDVDEFVFDGTAGQRVGIYSEVLSQDEYPMVVSGPAGPIAADSAGITRLPATGRYRVRLAPYAPGYPGSLGSYRVILYPVNPAPEQSPAALVDGQTTPEQIELPGDVDQFTFHAAAGELVGLEVWRQDPYQTLHLDVHDAATGVPLQQETVWFDSDGGGFYEERRFEPAQAHTYRVTLRLDRAMGRTVPDPLRYSLRVLWMSRAPDHVASGIALGDTVRGERIDTRGDIDEFTFHAEAGREVVVMADVPYGTAVDLLRDDTGGQVVRVMGFYSDGLDQDMSGRLQLPVTGTYRVRVHAGSPEPYQFVVRPIDRAPERAPAALTLGTTVDEAIDFRYEIDTFTFTAAAGELLRLSLNRLTGGTGTLAAYVNHPGTGEPLGYAFSTGGAATHTFTAPVAGTYRVMVLSSNATSDLVQYADVWSGRYQLTVSRLSP
jgi:hypothetical protein